MSSSASFTLSLNDLHWVGAGLARPECVLTTQCGDLYVSDKAGVARISPSGALTRYGGRTPEGEVLGANGFAMLQDGSFLVAPLCGGGVYRLYRSGAAEPFLTEVDGQPIPSPNFVLLDHLDRIWICTLAQRDRRMMDCFPRDLREGQIILLEGGRARIVADLVGYPNEVRVDPSGDYLYTNETMSGRLLRYPIAPNGDLGAPEVMAELDDSNMMDGFTLDAQGGAWITTLVSNRLWHLPRGGRLHCVIEQSNPAQLARLCAAQRSSGVTRDLFYEEQGHLLRNISSIAFGGADLRTAYLGSLMGERLAAFRAPVAGMEPRHWRFGPFA